VRQCETHTVPSKWATTFRKLLLLIGQQGSSDDIYISLALDTTRFVMCNCVMTVAPLCWVCGPIVDIFGWGVRLIFSGPYWIGIGKSAHRPGALRRRVNRVKSYLLTVASSPLPSSFWLASSFDWSRSRWVAISSLPTLCLLSRI
jgi:hypothetical protein